MKLRQAKKIGKYGQYCRQVTKQRAFARIWKHDVRKYGLPANYDCFMAIVWDYPVLGGKRP